MSHDPVTEDEREEMWRLRHEEGFNMDEIADEIGRSKSTVRNHLADMEQERQEDKRFESMAVKKSTKDIFMDLLDETPGIGDKSLKWAKSMVERRPSLLNQPQELWRLLTNRPMGLDDYIAEHIVGAVMENQAQGGDLPPSIMAMWAQGNQQQGNGMNPMMLANLMGQGPQGGQQGGMGGFPGGGGGGGGDGGQGPFANMPPWMLGMMQGGGQMPPWLLPMLLSMQNKPAKDEPDMRQAMRQMAQELGERIPSTNEIVEIVNQVVDRKVQAEPNDDNYEQIQRVMRDENGEPVIVEGEPVYEWVKRPIQQEPTQPQEEKEDLLDQLVKLKQAGLLPDDSGQSDLVQAMQQQMQNLVHTMTEKEEERFRQLAETQDKLAQAMEEQRQSKIEAMMERQEDLIQAALQDDNGATDQTMVMLQQYQDQMIELQKQLAAQQARNDEAQKWQEQMSEREQELRSLEREAARKGGEMSDDAKILSDALDKGESFLGEFTKNAQRRAERMEKIGLALLSQSQQQAPMQGPSPQRPQSTGPTVSEEELERLSQLADQAQGLQSNTVLHNQHPQDPPPQPNPQPEPTDTATQPPATPPEPTEASPPADDGSQAEPPVPDAQAPTPPTGNLPTPPTSSPPPLSDESTSQADSQEDAPSNEEEDTEPSPEDTDTGDEEDLEEAAAELLQDL